MNRIPLTLAALLTLVGCDPVGFAVKNDTTETVEIAHRFKKSDASCHTPECMGGEGKIAAASNLAFACPASEISYIELVQNGRTCRVGRSDLVAMGNELVASQCFTDVKFAGQHSPRS